MPRIGRRGRLSRCAPPRLPGTASPACNSTSRVQVYTRDGKPRQPGSLRKPGKVTDLPEWDQEMLDFFEELQTKPWNDDDFDPMP